jgi:hypothetical protein
MPSTSSTSQHATRTSTLPPSRRGVFGMARWFARPEPRAALGMVRDGMVHAELADGGVDEDRADRGGWHASSLDLAAGLRVCEVACTQEAEALIRRHFGVLPPAHAAH